MVRAGGYLSLSACGIAIADASAWCWGSGKALGNGTTEETYSTAVAVAPPAGVSTLSFQAIAVASETVCGLTMEGLWCWGDATNLPDPSIGFIALPQHFPLAGPLLAGGDGGFVLASGSSVRGFGTVYHWVGGPGELTMPNDFGGAQRGETATPVPVSAIAAGQTFCLTRADEQVMCSYGVMGKARWTGAFLTALPMLPVPDPELLE